MTIYLLGVLITTIILTILFYQFPDFYKHVEPSDWASTKLSSAFLMAWFWPAILIIAIPFGVIGLVEMIGEILDDYIEGKGENNEN